MRFVFIRAALLTTLLIFNGCASLGTIVDHQEAKEVKTMAILGFSIFLTSGAGPTVGFGGKKLTESQRNRKIQYEIFEELRRNIKEKTGWTVLSLEDLKKSKTYSNSYKERNYRPRMVDVKFEGVDALMDTHTASYLSSNKDKMKAIAAELGIDAYALYSENQLVANADLKILGKRVKVINDNFSAQSVSSLRVLNIETGRVIYQVQNIKGEEIFNDNFEENVAYRAKEDVLKMRASRVAMDRVFGLLLTE